MNKDVFSILKPGNPLMTSAVEALKLYHEAMTAKLPDEEIERLRLEAESLWKAMSEYQLRVMGCPSATLQ
ncbi:hypothetical protein [Pseudomonas vlassakiae]|uniref:Uncharacterized protein n=1 Tax=Pseudomonas vlassakiae TaxID=485888 RepID=A0A923GE23_9PSED|nr:hypothetical protein [Pseudomonas vlassakiae]MBV4540110.1 hypothetical protein [Pseudomonas vlassakiae]